MFVSVASVWEISIKHALAPGRPGDMPASGAKALGWFIRSGYAMLDITVRDAAAVEALAPLHADPFDRMIVAQALHEPMRLVTRDATVAAYDPGCSQDLTHAGSTRNRLAAAGQAGIRRR